MARRNNLRSDASGSFHFDVRTKTVMAEANQENIKEKVQAVREVVPGKSNNEVTIVLQYYDNNVERAIQAYLEDGAREALQDWNFTGSKQPNKKRKNKRKGNGDKVSEAGFTTLSLASNEKIEASVIGNSDLPNGDIVQGVGESKMDSSLNYSMNQSSTAIQDISGTVLSSSLPSSSEAHVFSKNTTLTLNPLPQRIPHNKRRGQGDFHNHQSENKHTAKERTVSEQNTEAEVADGQHRKPQQGLDKAIKDIHRQTTSLGRLRTLLDHEIDRSYKSLKGVFEELRQGLNDREAKLMTEMTVLKKEASEMLEMRQNKAADLKRQLDRSDKLKDTEISQLRAVIKHFVSERRHDDDLGRTTRFLYDSDHMMEEIKKFGEVVHIKSMYTAYSSPASSDTCNNNSHEGHVASHDDDQSHTLKVSELQDRLKGSLNLENSSDRSLVSGVHVPAKQNGAKHDDVSSSSATATSSQSSVAPSDSDQKNDHYSSNQGPSYGSSNFGSRDGGWYGGNSQGPRGRGRGRGFRGDGRGRVVYRSQRS